MINVTSADALAHEPGKLVRFHALWNFACVLGATVTGIALRLGASWRVVWAGLAVIVIIDGLLTYRSKVPEPARVEHPSMLRALIGLRHEGLAVLALVFAASAMVEGGLATFGVLYLRAHVGLGVLAGVGAYVVGNLLAMSARIGGTSIVNRFGTRQDGHARRVDRVGRHRGRSACASSRVLAASGLAAASLGISLVWPLLIADVSNEAQHPALAIGGVTAAGYLGMVAGPPIVGVVVGRVRSSRRPDGARRASRCSSRSRPPTCARPSPKRSPPKRRRARPAHRACCSGQLDLGDRRAVGAHVDDGNPVRGQRTSNEQVAMTVGRVAFAAHHRDAEVLGPGHEPLQAVAEPVSLGDLVVEHVSVGVVTVGLARATAQARRRGTRSRSRPRAARRATSRD